MIHLQPYIDQRHSVLGFQLWFRRALSIAPVKPQALATMAPVPPQAALGDRAPVNPRN